MNDITPKVCCICGSPDDLRIAPIMTGDQFGKPAKWPVCGECVRTWYESGETTAEGILDRRIREVLVETYTTVGRDLWLAHAKKQGWTREEQMSRALAMADGVFT